MICEHCRLPIRTDESYTKSDFIHLVSEHSNGHEYYGCDLASGMEGLFGSYAYPAEEEKEEEMALRRYKSFNEVLEMSTLDRASYFHEYKTYLDYAAVTPFFIQVGEKKLFANSEKELRNKFEDYIREEEFK